MNSPSFSRLLFVLLVFFTATAQANLYSQITELINTQESLTPRELHGLKDLKDLKEKINPPPSYVIYFLSSSCPCSQSHFNHLNELQKEFPSFQYIGFHSQKMISRKKAKKYFDQYEIDFPIYLDKELKAANLLKALKTPHVFIVSPQGELLFQGGATNSRDPKRASKFYLQNALAQLKKNNDITIKVAKTLGCYIQR